MNKKYISYGLIAIAGLMTYFIISTVGYIMTH